MTFIAPIYDRSQEDVAQRRPKAYLNYADLNRIDNNLQVLAEAFGVTVSSKSWEITDYPSAGQLARILGNLDAVKAAYYSLPSVPTTPGMPVNHYEKVNDIEKAIAELWRVWSENLSCRVRCGELGAGQTIGVL